MTRPLPTPSHRQPGEERGAHGNDGRRTQHCAETQGAETESAETHGAETESAETGSAQYMQAL